MSDILERYQHECGIFSHNIVEFFGNTDDPDVRKHAFKWSLNNACIVTCRWLLDRYDDIQITKFMVHHAILCCQLQFAELLMDACPDVIFDADYVVNVSRDGNLNTIKWLVKMCPNVSAKTLLSNYKIENHSYDVIKWIIETYTSSVDIGYLFDTACTTNNMRLVKYLVKKNLNIDVVKVFHKNDVYIRIKEYLLSKYSDLDIHHNQFEMFADNSRTSQANMLVEHTRNSDISYRTTKIESTFHEIKYIVSIHDLGDIGHNSVHVERDGIHVYFLPYSGNTPVTTVIMDYIVSKVLVEKLHVSITSAKKSAVF